MSRLTSLFLLLSAIACAVLFYSCTEPRSIAGGTSETTNGFVAVIHSMSGAPVSHALVRLRPEGYLSDTGNLTIPYDRSLVIDTFTDANGRFTLTDINLGNYCIEIQDGMGEGALLHCSACKDSIIDCGTVEAIPTGSVRGYINSKSVAVYVRVYGMQRVARADPKSGAFALYDMPQGDHELYFDASSPSYTPKILHVTVLPDSVSNVGNVSLFPFNGWVYSKVLGFNTTASGADVAGSVYAFPVLIRLNSGKFTFSQAMKNGEDIRFAKADSTPLAYEIERWDAGAGRAEIWVKMDTIFGNSDKQYITMYWGNSGATSMARSGAVFDTANGFQGIWHLGDGSADSIRDATGNRYNGVSPDSAKPSITEGVIGSCRTFDGSKDFITMPNTAGSKLNFPENSYYSVSAWVNLDSLDNSPHLVVAKGYEQYFLRNTYFPSNSPLWEFTEFSKLDSWQACTTKALSRQWTMLTGVRKGSRQLLYCNGVLVDSMPGIYQSATLSRDTSSDLTIGKFLQLITVSTTSESYCFFKGAIDEVRISSTALSSDWVRLCYMNQRADDLLVVFK